MAEPVQFDPQPEADDGIPTVCYCGGEPVVETAYTSKDPGRSRLNRCGLLGSAWSSFKGFKGECFFTTRVAIRLSSCHGRRGGHGGEVVTGVCGVAIVVMSSTARPLFTTHLLCFVLSYLVDSSTSTNERLKSDQTLIQVIDSEIKDAFEADVIQNKSLGKLRKRRKKKTETKAKNMEREICKLQKTLEDRICQLEASSSTATKVLTLTYPFVF
ncbi:hypothetical protein Bca52824_023756 [Brassica carinata]|uniref:Uncharacterized protein n=1 Tax=Brassica carinata TaxID=52824 RepID=A0A8X7VJ55_BRACI|nr:hypothetical protein Bca52824_023756 [Brassica carinata]